MSSTPECLRRIALGGLAVATGAAIAMIGVSAPANADAPQGLSKPSGDMQPLAQDHDNQTAAGLVYGFTNDFTANATITLTLPGRCDTRADIDHGIGFSAMPSLSIIRDGDTGATDPPFTASDTSSPQCRTAHVFNQLTVTLTQPSSTQGATDQLDLRIGDIGGIKYDVGTSAWLGDIEVTPGSTGITPSPPTTPVANATVTNASFTVGRRTSAYPAAYSSGSVLPTVTLKDTPGSREFPAHTCTPVSLALRNAGFTHNVTPRITVPAGYSVYKDSHCARAGTPVQDRGDRDAVYVYVYAFAVKAPATHAGHATVTVSGLKADTFYSDAGIGTAYITPTVGGITDSAHYPAMNVVYQEHRSGGTNRYETAVGLFKSADHNGDCSRHGNTPKGDHGCTAVLSSGEAFPDALSANYLAGELNTATLLTRQDSLPTEVKQALIDDCIGTVYITGQTAAVSQGVQDQVKAIHVCGMKSLPKIRVVRFGGADRYGTNQAANDYAASTDPPGDTAVLASGTTPYDALAVGPLVYQQSYNGRFSRAGGLPLVLTDGTALDNGELAQFQRLGTHKIVIVGGTTVVSQAVQDQLSADGYNVIRVAGATRYATATEIARLATTGIDRDGNGNYGDDGLYSQFTGDLDSASVRIANGQDFADALAAGPSAGQGSFGYGLGGQVILLVRDSKTVGSALRSYLGDPRRVGTESSGIQINEVNVVGGDAAVSPALVKKLIVAIGPGPFFPPPPEYA